MLLIFCGEVRQVIENSAALDVNEARMKRNKFADRSGKKLYKCSLFEELHTSYSIRKLVFSGRMALEHRRV